MVLKFETLKFIDLSKIILVEQSLSRSYFINCEKYFFQRVDINQAGTLQMKHFNKIVQNS